MPIELSIQGVDSRPSRTASREFTIPAGAVESDVIDIGGSSHLSFVLPEALDGNDCFVYVSVSPDGPFYSTGVTFESSVGISANQAAISLLSSFRYFKLVSNAPIAPLTKDGGSPAGFLRLNGGGQPILVNDPYVGIELSSGLLEGNVFIGDILTISGDPTTYTATEPSPVGSGVAAVWVSPLIAQQSPDGTAVTLTQSGIRGENPTKTIVAVVK